MPDIVVQTQGLTKYYGARRGVEDLDLQVGRGEIFGFLGPNGAGKTTTIRLLLDLLRPTRGQALVLGRDPRRDGPAVRAEIGYLPGELVLYESLSGEELVSYFGHLRGKLDWTYVRRLAERLDADLSRPVRSLSRGNRQKVGLILAFASRPALLVLDEPSTGLDPLMQQEFYRLLAEAHQQGQTIFISSHVLPEVERVCDRVAIIRQGRLVAVENVATLKRRAVRRLEIRFGQPVQAKAFSHVSGIRDLRVEDGILTCTIVGSIDPLIKAAARFEVLDVISHQPSLEEVFLAYYSGDRNDAA